LAALLSKNSRASDIVYRYGGEEFLAIIPKAKAEAAFRIAEKWRKDFMGSILIPELGGFTPSISCGISVFPAHGSPGTDLIARADQALYRAKNAGRNRSVVWDGSKD
jgi:diguanylate cyclase